MSFYRFLLLHLEVLGARRIAVRRDLHLVLAGRPGGLLGDVEVGVGGSGGGDADVLLLDHRAGVAEGPLGMELHGRLRRALARQRGEDGVLGTERGGRVGDLLVRTHRLAQVDRGDLEGHRGRGGLDRRLRSGRDFRRGSRRRSLLRLLVAAEQREAAYEDQGRQGRGAMEAHGFSPLTRKGSSGSVRDRSCPGRRGCPGWPRRCGATDWHPRRTSSRSWTGCLPRRPRRSARSARPAPREARWRKHPPLRRRSRASLRHSPSGSPSKEETALTGGRREAPRSYIRTPYESRYAGPEGGYAVIAFPRRCRASRRTLATAPWRTA